MSPRRKLPNSLQARRAARRWSQQDLADHAGVSRAGVSAIETGRLAPSVTAALVISRALDCTVEDLFDPSSLDPRSAVEWAFPPNAAHRRYWRARVGDSLLAFPVEDDSPQLGWHDGVNGQGPSGDLSLELADRTLVVACCDPAAGLLAAEYARQFGFRMIVLRRSSREALSLLAAGKVHAAGVHLGRAGGKSENARVARSLVGDCTLVRVARWEEGLALGPRIRMARMADVVRPRLRWIGREPGSGARQCQDQVLGHRPPPRRIAFDHRSVAAALRCGWADVGPCLRLTSEEAGLRFLKVEQKDYDLCFRSADGSDPRLATLLGTLRSRTFRRLLSDLPGYSSSDTGELL